MPTGALSPVVRQQAWNLGVVSPGAKLTTALSGTSTPQVVYQDAALTTPHTNPLVADSGGRFAAFYLAAVAYRMTLTDANDAVIWGPTDNIYDFAQLDAADGLGTTALVTYGTTIAAGQAVYLSDGSGGNTAGRFYLADADFSYASSLAPQIGIALSAGVAGGTGLIQQTGRVTNQTGLVAGTTYFVSATAGALTSSAPANSRVVGTADTTTSLVLLNSASGAVMIGSNTQVIYNDGGVLAGDADFTFDKANNLLAIPRIQFPATQAPSAGVNVLDDYEEFTWTPTDGSGAGLSLTASGSGVKIGRLVVAQYNIVYPSTANGSNSRIAGLPFTAAAASGFGNALAFTSAATTLTAEVNSGAATADFYDSTGAHLTNATLSTDTIRGTLIYLADA